MNVRARYRNPRIPFSTVEVTTLETKFVQSPYLGTNDVNELAVILNMSPKRVCGSNIGNKSLRMCSICSIKIRHLFNLNGIVLLS